jgi:regulator of replication initiation timing
MNGFDDFKKEILKKIKQLQYTIKKLTQRNDELTKTNKIINEWLNISRSQNTKLIAENFHFKKIIAGQKRKIKDECLVETDEEMEMPKGLGKTSAKGKKIKI